MLANDLVAAVIVTIMLIPQSLALTLRVDESLYFATSPAKCSSRNFRLQSRSIPGWRRVRGFATPRHRHRPAAE